MRRVRDSSSRPAEPTGATAAGVAEGAVTLVALDDELDRLHERLQQALGPSYLVVTGASDAAAAVVPAQVARVEALRAAQPRAYIVVYDSGSSEPGPYLEANADDYVAAASMAELAARIRAGLRRLGWQRADGRPARRSP